MILQIILYAIMIIGVVAFTWYVVKDGQRRYYIKGFTEGYKQAGILEKNNVIFPDEPTTATVPVEVIETMANAFYDEHRSDV